KINTYHVSMLPYFLARLKGIQEADGHLLEKSLILYGSPMGDSNLHNHKRCPLMLLGHAGGRLKGGRHVQVPVDTPMANAMLAALQMLGVRQERLGDSTGAMELNAAAGTTTTASRQGA
ncbi:MAG TPA: hypothetical protein VND92_08480, partial [Vicinamibacterales bacterium]|nr:hypothetical protein [Vicinamibacterales bacterium]